MAADEGVVEFAGYKSGGLGNAVIINHNNGFKTTYGHMKSVKVKKGQIVEKGDVIGIMGSTGHSTGTHFHFEVYLNGRLGIIRPAIYNPFYPAFPRVYLRPERESLVTIGKVSFRIPVAHRSGYSPSKW